MLQALDDSITLPAGVDTSKITAKVKDGILDISISKDQY